MTIGVYLLEQRLERAQYLLRASTMRIENIGKEVGFKSISHFGKQFHRYTGVLPKDYRHRAVLSE